MASTNEHNHPAATDPTHPEAAGFHADSNPFASDNDHVHTGEVQEPQPMVTDSFDPWAAPGAYI